jgi:hypothetical protein
VLRALLVPAHAGRNNRIMHLIGLAGTYTPPEGGESNHWIVHMNSDALSLGTYSIPAGGVDDQEPHTEDEVYVVQAGRATLVTASGTVPVEPGSVVFVPAGETHKFTPRYGSRTPAEITAAEQTMVAASPRPSPVRQRVAPVKSGRRCRMHRRQIPWRSLGAAQRPGG